MRTKMIHRSLNTYFHIVNHSIDGRKLYYDPGDYKTYLYLFKKVDYKVTVIAYCLILIISFSFASKCTRSN